jgi:hypothetical protein
MDSLASSLSASNVDTDDKPVNSNCSSNSSVTPTPTTTPTATPADVTATPPILPDDGDMPAAGESSAPSVIRMVDDGDTAATNFQPRQRHILASEHDLESLEEDDADDDDGSEGLQPGAFAVSEYHVTHQLKGILTFATSTPHASITTSGDFSSGKLSKTVDSYCANNIVQNTEDVQKVEEEPCFKSQLCRSIFLVMAIGVGAGIAFATKSSPGPTPTPAPSLAPTPAPTSGERFHKFVDFLAVISERELLEDPSTAQSKAVRWLANIDQGDLDINTMMDDEVVLQERYLMAVLYYSSESRMFLESLDFLEESSVCSWNDGDHSGVFCDDGVQVSKIRFCKLCSWGSRRGDSLLSDPFLSHDYTCCLPLARYCSQ